MSCALEMFWGMSAPFATGRKSQTVPRSYLWLHFIDPKHTKTKAPSLQCLDAEWQHAPSAGWVNRQDATSHGGAGALAHARINVAGLLALHELRTAWAQFPTSNGCGPSLALWPRDLGFVRFSWAMHGHGGLGMAGPILVKFWFQSCHWNALVLPQFLLRWNLPTVAESYVLGGHCAKMWGELRRSENSWALRKVEDEVRKELRRSETTPKCRNSYGQNLSFTPVVEHLLSAGSLPLALCGLF